MNTDSTNMADGFSLIELLIVIVVLGLLATVVVFSVRGITDEGQDSTCSQHRRVLSTAIEAYFADSGSAMLPAVGVADGEEYERGLVQAHMMREVSVYFSVDANGDLVPEAGSPCTI